MAGEPIDDVLEWSGKLSLWKQDALRRLAVSNELTEADTGHLGNLTRSEFLVGQVRINSNLFCFEHKKPIAFPPAKVDSSIVRNWR